MNHPPEYYISKPNLLRVATEISKMNHPEKIVNTLAAMLAAYAGKEPLAPLPVPEGQTNNEKFNALLNSCQHSQAVFNALSAFAEAGKEAAV